MNSDGRIIIIFIFIVILLLILFYINNLFNIDNNSDNNNNEIDNNLNIIEQPPKNVNSSNIYKSILNCRNNKKFGLYNPEYKNNICSSKFTFMYGNNVINSQFHEFKDGTVYIEIDSEIFDKNIVNEIKYTESDTKNIKMSNILPGGIIPKMIDKSGEVFYLFIPVYKSNSRCRNLLYIDYKENKNDNHCSSAFLYKSLGDYNIGIIRKLTVGYGLLYYNLSKNINDTSSELLYDDDKSVTKKIRLSEMNSNKIENIADWNNKSYTLYL